MKNMRWELSGSLRLRDHEWGRDVLAGVRIIVDGREARILVNDGRGGPAETMVVTNPVALRTVRRIVQLVYRNAFSRPRHLGGGFRYQSQEVAR